MINKNGGNQQLLLDIFRAYFDARKNKRSTANALAFESGYEEKLFKLYEDIMNRTYTLGRSVCFIVDKPVKREIIAAKGIKRVNHFIRSCSENYQKECWVLKLDIKGYFMAIDKNILYKKIECKHFKGQELFAKRIGAHPAPQENIFAVRTYRKVFEIQYGIGKRPNK